MPHDGGQEAVATDAHRFLVERKIPADFRWVQRAIHEIEDELISHGITRQDVGSVSIILAEAFNNVVEHAYGESEEGEIEVTIRRRNQSIIFEICDDGRPMPNGRPPAGSVPDADGDHLDSLPEGGFGWLLIRELVRDLIYDRRDDQNILIFRYRLED